ncbi:PAS domain-containing protein [Microvirga rosea]|uniref:PAS domain-containing protein n=1 Tax=Microvirga rosea TaxID=2715425 RepID=UPI0029CAB975|nr:PAS domain-containing protein [Microvirga rosea]
METERGADLRPSRRRALEQSPDLIFPEHPRARGWEGFRHAMATGESHYGVGDPLSVPGTCQGGQQVLLEFTIVPRRDAQSQMHSLVTVMRDVTSRFEEIKVLKKKLAETILLPSPH